MVPHYDSVGLSAGYGSQGEDFSFYTFYSVTRTEGFEARHFKVDGPDEAGYIGDDLDPDAKPLET